MATRNESRHSFLLVRDAGGRVLCERCLVADRPFARMRGLLGRRSLPAGEGLLLRPASSIHTAFMHFAIDAVFLDRDGVVMHIARDLRPWRTTAKRGAKAVLELPAGSADRRGLELGEKLRLVSPGERAGAMAEATLPPRNESEAELASFAGRNGR